MSRSMGLAQPSKPTAQAAPKASAVKAKPAAAQAVTSSKTGSSETRVKISTSEAKKTVESAGSAESRTADTTETHRSTRHHSPVAEAQVEESTEAPRTTTTSESRSARPQVSGGARPDRVVQFAQVKDEKVAPQEKASAAKMGFSVVFKLVLVLGLAYVSILALKLLSTKRGIVSGSNQDMRVVDTIKLTPTNSLHVVDFNGKKMLVGSSSGQVNLLREFEEVEIPQPEPASEGRFAEYLTKYSGTSFEKSPAGRVAGLLRDCATHLKTRQGDAKTGNQFVGKTNEA
jgi:flagellar biogenesis protein FliO